jgi:hypothetical protein
VRDVVHLIPLARTLGYIDMHNVFMLGWSRGGMMTYLTLKHHLPVNAVAVIGGLTDLVALGKRRPTLVNVWRALHPDFEQLCADPGVLRDPTDPLSEPGCRRKHGQKHQKEKHVQAESPTDDGKWTRFPDTSKAHLPYIPSTCYPSICYPKFLHNGDPLQQRFDRQGPLLDEHQRRLWAAAAVQTLERGCARAFTSS